MKLQTLLALTPLAFGACTVLKQEQPSTERTSDVRVTTVQRSLHNNQLFYMRTDSSVAGTKILLCGPSSTESTDSLTEGSHERATQCDQTRKLYQQGFPDSTVVNTYRIEKQLVERK